MRRREAFEDLYRLHAAAAWRVAWVILRNRDDAADAVAEAFAKLYAAGVPPQADFRSYLLTAVRNASIDVLRKSRRLELTGTVDPSAGVEPVPTDPAVVGENRAYMAQAFADLPERWRSALWLIDVEELSTHDAGSILGVAPNTAAQLASRARGRVRQHFLQAHVANHVRPECRTAVAALGAHAAGTLPPGRRARLDEHLAACDDCATRRADLDDLRVALRAVPPPLPLALLEWTAPRQRGSFLAVLDHLQAAPSTAAAQVVAHASPVISAAGERLVAAATATVLVASMSVAALKGGDPAQAPADAGRAPSFVAAAATPPPGPGTGAGPVAASSGGSSPPTATAASPSPPLSLPATAAAASGPPAAASGPPAAASGPPAAAGPSSAGPSLAGPSSAGPSSAGPTSPAPTLVGPISLGPATAGPASGTRPAAAPVTDPGLPKAVPAVLGATMPLVAGSTRAALPAASAASGATAPIAPATGALPAVTLPPVTVPAAGGPALAPSQNPLPSTPLPSVAPLVGGLVPAATAPTAALPIGNVAATAVPGAPLPAATLPTATVLPTETRLPLGPALPPVSTPPVSTAPVSTPPLSTPPLSTPPVSTVGEVVPAAQGVVGGGVGTVAQAPSALPAVGPGPALPATGGALGSLLALPGGLPAN